MKINYTHKAFGDLQSCMTCSVSNVRSASVVFTDHDLQLLDRLDLKGNCDFRYFPNNVNQFTRGSDLNIKKATQCNENETKNSDMCI